MAIAFLDVFLQHNQLRGATPHAHAAKAEASGGRLVDCAESSFCTEVADPASAFPGYKYVGHDERSDLP